MYGGLFGDLPATKNDATKGNDSHDGQQAAVITATGADTVGIVPPRVDRSPAAQDATKTVGVAAAASAVAAAVPTMLPRFIPTQATRPRQQQQQRERKRPLPSNSQHQILTTAALVIHNVHGENIGSSSVTTATAMTGASTMASSIGQTPSENKVGVTPIGRRDAAASETNTAAGTAHDHRHVYPLQESEQLRLLHERAKEEDPYDPMVPNDVLHYWERKSLAVEREKLMLQQMETIREQELLRQQLEQERMQLEKQGDIDKIVQHSMLQGMGRGRGGVSNLPAWLVEKQKKQQQQSQSQQPFPDS